MTIFVPSVQTANSLIPNYDLTGNNNNSLAVFLILIIFGVLFGIGLAAMFVYYIRKNLKNNQRQNGNPNQQNSYHHQQPKKNYSSSPFDNASRRAPYGSENYDDISMYHHQPNHHNNVPEYDSNYIQIESVDTIRMGNYPENDNFHSYENMSRKNRK